MKTRQPMTKNRDVMHKRISQLCNYLNENNITDYSVASHTFKIGRWYFVTMRKSGIIWKEDNYWRGTQRLTEQRLDKFVELSKAYHKRYIKKEIKQCEIKFPKLTPQVTQQVAPPVAKTRKLRKVSLIKRIKFLFTGKI